MYNSVNTVSSVLEDFKTKAGSHVRHCTCMYIYNYALILKQKRFVSQLSESKNRSNLSCLEHILQNFLSKKT